jgi:hypothetical protein
MSNVLADCTNGIRDHPSLNHSTKRKNRSKGHRKNNQKNHIDLNKYLRDLCQLFESNAMASIIKCLNTL